MPSICYVTARDHGIHWQGVAAVPPPAPAPIYDGPDRRSGLDRRRGSDRRADAVRGRRYRLTDRRRVR